MNKRSVYVLYCYTSGVCYSLKPVCLSTTFEHCDIKLKRLTCGYYILLIWFVLYRVVVVEMRVQNSVNGTK